MAQEESLPQPNDMAINDASLFQAEELLLSAAEEILAGGPHSESSWSTHYKDLVFGYRNLLRHAKLVTNIGDLMQKDLNEGNERLREAQERERGLRAQLVYSQKMEAIGTLAGGIAHDFNNLLTVINGFTEMALMEKSEDAPCAADLRKVLETGRKAAQLVQRLQTFSRRTEISPRPQDVNIIVQNALKIIEPGFPKNIDIDATLAPNLFKANVDGPQIEQVLVNLCINAKEAMPGGGLLRIETRNISVDEGYCRFHPVAKLGPYVLLEVTDNGVGMDKATMDRLFDPFFTTKDLDFQKGKGLGLAVAKGVIELHGGWITCESERSEGTTFKVYLPSWRYGPEDVGFVPETSEAAHAPKKILLVDDEAFVRDLGVRILEHQGYSVVTASDGRAALDIYERERSEIGLIILDLVMPLMGGEECLEALSKFDPPPKVIVSTGRALDAEEKRKLAVFAGGFVNKPYQVRQLAETVRIVLQGGESSE